MIGRQMISFPLEGMRFNYRVAAIIVVDGHLLISRRDDDDYTMLPGGRVELGETSDSALAREIAEETGYAGSIGTLAMTSETFYRRDDVVFHEVGLFYRAALPDVARPDGRSPWLTRHDEGHELTFFWVPLAAGDLDAMRLLPSWLPAALEEQAESGTLPLRHVIEDRR